MWSTEASSFSRSTGIELSDEMRRIALPLGHGRGASSVDAGFAGLMNEVRVEIADFIERGSASVANTAPGVQAQAYLAKLNGGAAAVDGAAGISGSAEASAMMRRGFLAQVAPWVEATASRLGVAPEILTAHAALESAWGQRPIRQADGSDSNNLFGIKAGSDWSGARANVTTHEYESGALLKKTESFRSYADPGEAFEDFAQLLKNHYPAVLNSGNNARVYAQGLVHGRYASDPGYAEKLVRIATRLQSGD